MFNAGSHPVTMSNVNANSLFSSANNYGIYNFDSVVTMVGGTAAGTLGAGSNVRALNWGGTSKLDAVTTIGSGGSQARGIVNNGSATVELVRVTATGSGGSLNQNWGVDHFESSQMIVRDSFITGTPKSILNNGGTVNVANTGLSSAGSGANLYCLHAYLNVTPFTETSATCG